MIEVIEKAVGKVTLLKDNFEHCGIKHESSDKAIVIDQNHYAAQLRPIDEALLGSHAEDEEVKSFNEELVTLVEEFATSIRTDRSRGMLTHKVV